MITRELKNIAETYNQYSATKSQYQSGEVSKEKVILKFESLCKALFDFIQRIHTDAESEAEKDEIKAIGKYIETYF